MERTSRSSDDQAARRTGAWVAGLSALAFVLLAAFLIPWDWLPGGDIPKVRADQVFSPAQIARAEDYGGVQRSLGTWQLVVSLVVGAVLGLTPLGARVVRRLPRPWWLAALLGALMVLLAGELATLPFDWRSQRIDLEHGMSTQAWSAWAWDQVLGLLVSWVLTGIVVVVLLAIMRRAPRRWPAIAAGAAIALSFAGSYVYPVLVAPLFNDFSPMQPGPLRSEIMQLTRHEGVSIDRVLVADASRRTTTLNAYVSGIGSTRRVVVYDNLLDGLPRDQVLVVVAHELGHAKHRDVLVGTGLGALGGAVGVGLLGLLLPGQRLRRRTESGPPGDAANVPLLLALTTIGMLLAAPVQSTMSRAVEARADRVALEATGAERAFVTMQRQLSLRALSDPTPPAWRQLWFGSHPTSLERIGLARALGRRQ